MPHLQAVPDDLLPVVRTGFQVRYTLSRGAEGRHRDLGPPVRRGWQLDVCHVVVLAAVTTQPPT